MNRRFQLARRATLAELPEEHEQVISGPGTTGAGGGKTQQQPAQFAPARGPVTITRGAFFVLNGVIPGSGAAMLLPANRKRIYFEFSNESFATPVRINFGGNASNSAGVRVPPGATRVWDVVCPIDGIYIFSTAPGEPWSLTEGNQI